jgi:hypothetical protein
MAVPRPKRLMVTKDRNRGTALRLRIGWFRE